MDIGGFEALAGGTIAAAIIKLFDHFTSKRDRKNVHERIDVVEKEMRNGRTGQPLDPDDTLRSVIDEVRTLSRQTADTSRQTLSLVTSVIEEQQYMREEVRGLGQRLSAAEEGQDDLESELHAEVQALRKHVDDQLPKIVSRAAQAMGTLKSEPAGQVANPTFLQQLDARRPGEGPEKG